MDETITLDEEITRRYRAGEHALAIAGQLNIRAAEVIGRIRVLGLVPTGMAERRPPPPQQRPGLRPAALAAAPAEAVHEALPSSPAKPAVPAQAGGKPARPAEARTPEPRAPEARNEPRAAARPGFRPPVEELDDDIADTDMVTVNGCPRGWLISEAELERRYRGLAGRYEDVRFKSRDGNTAARRAA